MRSRELKQRHMDLLQTLIKMDGGGSKYDISENSGYCYSYLRNPAMMNSLNDLVDFRHGKAFITPKGRLVWALEMARRSKFPSAVISQDERAERTKKVKHEWYLRYKMRREAEEPAKPAAPTLAERMIELTALRAKVLRAEAAAINDQIARADEQLHRLGGERRA